MWTPELAFIANYAQQLRGRLASALPAPPAEGDQSSISSVVRAAEDVEPEPSLEPDPPDLSTLPIGELAALYDLDETDQDILLFASALRLDPTLSIDVARLNAPLKAHWASPVSWLRLVSTQDASRYWSEQWRFGSHRPLRRAGLMRLENRNAGTILESELVVPNDVLSMLRGDRELDERIAQIVSPVSEEAPMPAAPAGVLAHLQAIVAGHELEDAEDVPAVPWREMRATFVILAGARGTGKTLAVQSTCSRLGLPLLHVDGDRLASMPRDHIGELVQAALRQAALQREVLLIDGAERALEPGSPAAAALRDAGRFHRALVVLTVRDPEKLDPRLRDASPGRLVFPDPGFEVAAHAWDLMLGSHGIRGIDPTQAAERFPLDGRQIANSTRLSRLVALGSETDDVEDVFAIPSTIIAQAANSQLDDDLGGLGTSEKSEITLDDLVLDPILRGQLDEIVSASKNWRKLYDEWGFGRRIHRGRGLICLFDGDPGTGKTMSAEVLANALELKLVRVNTSQIIDKYIGETEKRLAALFARAHPGLHMLLFDEADSLFGKRTKVERSSDRYANAAINVLLQLVEHYEGLIVLTTNLKQGIDPAFERRFSFKLRFGVPDKPLREEIWRRFIPPSVPLAETLDFEYLGQEFELTGGGIKTAVVRAAYLALKHGQSLSMDHLLEAGYRELASSGKLVRADWEE